MSNNNFIVRNKNYIYKAYRVKNELNFKYTSIQKHVEEGTLSVGVFTALQALPVKDAEITVYDILEDGKEHIHAHSITDENGRISDIELPVQHDQLHLFGSSKYHFTTYNIRVIAENYYPVNVLNFRIFPGERTHYRIEMFPVIPGETVHTPEQTIIIPKSLIDEQNY